MKKKQKAIVALSAGGAALFFLIAVCSSRGGERERTPEPGPAVVVEPAAEPDAELPVGEPEIQMPIQAGFVQSFEDVIEPDPLPERFAPTEGPFAEDRPPASFAPVADLFPPVVEEKEKPRREPVRYVVKPGETYCSIAKEVYGSTRYFFDIELANGIEPHRLRAGQGIVLPRIDGVDLKLPEENAEHHEPEVGEYTIEDGDTLGQIALKLYGTSRAWKRLVEANPGIRPRKLMPGTAITVPPLGDEPR